MAGVEANPFNKGSSKYAASSGFVVSKNSSHNARSPCCSPLITFDVSFISLSREPLFFSVLFLNEVMILRVIGTLAYSAGTKKPDNAKA